MVDDDKIASLLEMSFSPSCSCTAVKTDGSPAGIPALWRYQGDKRWRGLIERELQMEVE